MSTKEENIATLLALAEVKNKELVLSSGASEEIADAYTVINRDKVVSAITQIYELVEEVGLLK